MLSFERICMNAFLSKRYYYEGNGFKNTREFSFLMLFYINLFTIGYSSLFNFYIYSDQSNRENTY